MSDSQYLQHYGIPKMRWGVRRFQNEDGSLTEAGKKRYGVKEKSKRTYVDDLQNAYKKDVTENPRMYEKYFQKLEKSGTFDDGYPGTGTVNSMIYDMWLDDHRDVVDALKTKHGVKDDPQRTAMLNKVLKEYEQLLEEDKPLAHYGIPKMRWGVRRFQNEDGSLTEEGRKRYGKEKKSKTQEQPKEPPKPLTNEEIVNSGDPNVVLANVNRLSTQEIQAAKNRIQEINNIKNLSMGEIRKKKENVLKRGAKLIGKAIADQTADSVTKVTKGVTSYAIKKTVKKTLPDNWEWKGVIVSALNSSDNSNQNQNQNQNQGKKKK